MSPVEVVQEPFCSHNGSCTAVRCRVPHAPRNGEPATEGALVAHGVRREQLHTHTHIRRCDESNIIPAIELPRLITGELYIYIPRIAVVERGVKQQMIASTATARAREEGRAMILT